METDRDNPAEQTPVVRTNSPSANEENLTPQEQFKKAMSCWNSAPEETLRLFFNILGNSKSSKNIVAQVNKKLAEIKKTNGYKHPKTIAQKDQYNNIGYLLYLGEKTKGPKPSSTKQELKSSKETKQHTPNTNNTSPSASSKKKKKHTPKAQPAESKENTPSQKLSQEVKVANPSSKKVEQKQAIEDRGPDLPQDVPQDLLRTEEKSPAAIEMATLSGEGSSLHSSPLAEVNVNNDLPKELRSTVSENKEPNAKEKGPKTNVGKTLEQKISPKKLPRRNSIDHLPIEPGLTAERPKLRRADTVKNLPTFASTADENHHPHKKPSSKKISLSNLLPRKERSSKKSQNILNEKDPITPKEKSKGKRLSVTTVDSSPSESEGEGKKTPRTKKSKKSSSSSRSSSMESSVRANNIEDSLISHNELPEKSLDYYPRHYRLLHQILTHKYKLDSDDQDTLAVILGERERSFEIDSHKIKRLFAQFETTKGSHHKRHEVIDGMGLTLNPNADGLKKGSYNAQLEQAKEKLITILAPTLTIADYEAAQKNSSSQNNTNH